MSCFALFLVSLRFNFFISNFQCQQSHRIKLVHQDFITPVVRQCFKSVTQFQIIVSSINFVKNVNPIRDWAIWGCLIEFYIYSFMIQFDSFIFQSFSFKIFPLYCDNSSRYSLFDSLIFIVLAYLETLTPLIVVTIVK